MNAVLPAVYGFIVDQCLKDYLFDAELVAHEWNCSVNELLLEGVRSLPGRTMNLIIGSECRSKFGPEILATVPGFISFSRTPLLCDCREYGKQCWCDRETWLLDLDVTQHPRGLLMPQCDEAARVLALWIFRHHRDQKPFLLRSRKREFAA